MDKKIAVLATGTNGSVISADLIRAGLDVTMIDMWGAHIEAMRANGLTITTDGDEVNVAVKAYHLSDVCTLQEKFDIVLLTSKAYDSRWLTEFIKPYLADDGLIVAVQNCMTAEMIAEIVGVERTVGCVIELATQMFDPGQVLRTTPKERTWFGIGAFDPAHGDRLEEVAEILRNAGEVEIIDDILSAKWMKLISNAMIMGTMAILGGTPEQVFKQNGKEYAQRAREWFLQAGEEALAVGQSLDYKAVPIFGLKPEDVTNTNNLLETLLDKLVDDIGPKPINTTLQDFMKGRYSETDMINGLVADELKQNGRPSPVNDVTVELTRQIHAGELKPDLSNLDLVRQMLANGG
ncbi:MAG: 2-dehydropantoate 2-reductase [Alphaproteobacteria bacterium]|jgi:2-dehydropantoate 2-reductase